ncbi:hypothetical protein AC1031_021558 [Aphanomyces cochlioides]|nr:hypothetical protein AC1031_021558 [Aphanomyces cochlioides]
MSKQQVLSEGGQIARSYFTPIAPGSIQYICTCGKLQKKNPNGGFSTGSSEQPHFFTPKVTTVHGCLDWIINVLHPFSMFQDILTKIQTLVVITPAKVKTIMLHDESHLDY